MLDKVKSIREGIVIAGDGRHDSMGHSAKFGAYTIFCCTVPMILHFSLVQVSTNHYFGGISSCICGVGALHVNLLKTVLTLSLIKMIFT